MLVELTPGGDLAHWPDGAWAEASRQSWTCPRSGPSSCLRAQQPLFGPGTAGSPALVPTPPAVNTVGGFGFLLSDLD